MRIRSSRRNVVVTAAVIETLERRALLSSVAMVEVSEISVPDVALNVIATNPSANFFAVSGENAVHMLFYSKGTISGSMTYSMTGDPAAIAIADLNGDGLDDVVTANFDGSISTRLNNGNGTFGAEQNLPAGMQFAGIATGDFNHDGRADVAVVDSRLDRVDVLLSNTDGTLGTTHFYSIGITPSAVTVGDFNHDGKLDLACANSDDYTVSVLLGNGDGTFTAPRTIHVGPDPIAIAAADLNGDGKVDLITASRAGESFSVLLGKGDGTFSAAKTVFAGTRPNSLVVADFNQDGIPDLAAADEGNDQIVELLGDGDGTFGSPLTTRMSEFPVSLAALDYNGDSRPDLMAVNYHDSSVSYVYNTPIPAAPSLTSPAKNATGLSLRPTLKWKPASDAEAYNIAIATSSAALPRDPLGNQIGAGFTLLGDAGDPDYTLFGDLSPDTTYYWEVQDNDHGDWSSIRKFTTAKDTAPAIKKLPSVEMAEISALSLTGSFTDADPGDSWTATVNYGDGSGTHTLSLTSKKTFHLSHAYKKSGNFVVTVKITDSYGMSGSATEKVLVDPTRD